MSTNTQHAELMAELVGIGRTLQRIADSCERAEARASETPAVRDALQANADYVAITEVRVPPPSAPAPSPAVRKHKGRRS